MSQAQQTNGHQQPGGQLVDGMSRQDLLDMLVETGMDERLTTPVRNLLARDFPLANIRRSDREYFRLLSENIVMYASEQFPPSDSLMQGAVGAALTGDPEYDRESLSEQKRNELQSLLLVTFARSSRGVGGWQQDKLTESIDTRRIEDDRVDDEEPGFLSGLFK